MVIIVVIVIIILTILTITSSIYGRKIGETVAQLTQLFTILLVLIDRVVNQHKNQAFVMFNLGTLETQIRPCYGKEKIPNQNIHLSVPWVCVVT